MHYDHLREFAWEVVPVIARMPHVQWDNFKSWIPAHELSHALIASPYERQQTFFGIADGVTPHESPYDDWIERAQALELAAIQIDIKLHLACGRVDLVEEEMAITDDQTLLSADDPKMQRRVHRLLVERDCLRIPRTMKGLVEFCRRRGLRRSS